MVKIIQALIPKQNRNRPGNRMKPLYITVHNTSNTGRGQMRRIMQHLLLGLVPGLAGTTLSMIRSFISIYL